MLDSITPYSDCMIGQPGFRMEDLPVLNRCFKKREVREIDYLGQQWGTGESHTIREFVNLAFAYAGIEIEWHSTGPTEQGIVASSNLQPLTSNLQPGSIVVEIDPRYFRPTEVDFLQADIAKARRQLGWAPRITFSELVKIMVDYDLRMVGLTPPGEGIAACQAKDFCYTEHTFATNEQIRER